MRTILLIMIGISSLVGGDFTRNANGVVIDSRTNLEWQDDYSDNSKKIKEATWQDAIDYCESLTLDGHTNWRLPNVNELISLLDYYSKQQPLIDASFENTYSNYYWSSSSEAKLHNYVWIIHFYYGYQYSNTKNKKNSVRCVRRL